MNEILDRRQRFEGIETRTLKASWNISGHEGEVYPSLDLESNGPNAKTPFKSGVLITQ